MENIYLKIIGVQNSPVVAAAIENDVDSADRFMMNMLLIHWFAAATISAYHYGQYYAGILCGGFICGVAWIGLRLLSGTIYPRILMGVCLMLFSALYIQQNLGRIEIHFHIFVALAFLIRYKSLLPLVAAVVTIATHHLVVNYCQTINFELLSTPLVVFDYGSGLGIVFLHASFVVIEALVLGYIIIELTRQYGRTVQENSNTQTVIEVLNHVIETKDTSGKVEGNNEYAHVVNSLLSMMKKQIATTEALRGAASSIFITDTSGEIINVNHAASELFKSFTSNHSEQSIDFNPAELVGTNVACVFGGNAAPESLAGTSVTSNLSIGERELEVTVTPIITEQGGRLGSIFEWQELKQQINIQNEVQSIVDSAKRGDLSRRVTLDGKSGFYQTLSLGINGMLDNTSHIINELAQVLSSMAKGDLTQSITGEFEGQYFNLQNDTNTTIERLCGIVSDIQLSIGTLSEVSVRLADSNGGLTQQTNLQVNEIEKTVSTMETMTETVNQTLGHTKTARESADQAHIQASHSKTISTDAISAMDQINESSEKIYSIISVINEISFQTNLLALNASVEAARAGDKGRGFAVVASEVRELAGRSANAAKEIKQLIEESARCVSDGTEHVNRTADALDDIIKSVNDMSGIMEKIGDVADYQAKAIVRVQSDVDHIKTATHLSTTLVAQSADASGKTEELATQLSSLVEFFDITNNTKNQKAA